MTIAEKLTLGYPLSPDEARSLAALDLLELGRLAHGVRERLHASQVYVRPGATPHSVTFAPDSLPTAIDRLIALRAAGYPAIAPVAEQHGLATTGDFEIRLIALARLILDTVPHIAADWTLLSPAIAQAALRFGADELTGIPAAIPIAELERQVRDAGLELATDFRPPDDPDPLRILA